MFVTDTHTHTTMMANSTGAMDEREIPFIFTGEPLSRTSKTNLMRPLSADDHEAVLLWLEQFELCKSRKAIGRDFSDGVLLAQLLKRLYPKLVELHNYPPRNSFTLKLDNWNTLNRKVLRKLGLQQSGDMLTHLCSGTAGALEHVCLAIMQKHQADERNSAANLEGDENASDNTDIMCVNVERKNGAGVVQQVVQKMVAYKLYERSQTTVYEQQQAITILTQKIEHLDNLLKLKCQRIEDLLAQLARKSCRLKVESELCISGSEPTSFMGQMLDDEAPAKGQGDGRQTTRSLMY